MTVNAASAPLLSVERLVRRYGERTVVDIESLRLHAGETLAVLGPNGAGKSTLFRMLLLLEPPDAGTVHLNGRPVRCGDTDAARSLAAVFQRPYLFAGTAAENVAYGLRVRGVPRKERAMRVERALMAVGLLPFSAVPTNRLSGGEAQRVALARALAVEPVVLLMDEPTANLDIAVRRQFREDIERNVRAGVRAAILITHDPADAFALANRIVVMQEGRIVQEGTPSDLLLSPATPFVAAMTGAELLLDGLVEQVEEGIVIVRLAGGAQLVVAGASAELPAPGAGVHVGYRPEDVLLADPADAGATSAVNRFSLRIAAIAPSGALVRVRLDGLLPLTALLTRRSANALSLSVGSSVVAQLKATALRTYGSA